MLSLYRNIYACMRAIVRVWCDFWVMQSSVKQRWKILERQNLQLRLKEVCVSADECVINALGAAVRADTG